MKDFDNNEDIKLFRQYKAVIKDLSDLKDKSVLYGIIVLFNNKYNEYLNDKEIEYINNLEDKINNRNEEDF